jgi:LPS export ABC transporter protein LptC
MRRALFVLSALVVAATAAACTDAKQPPVVAGPSIADSAEQVLIQVRSVLTTKGVQRGVLTADTAYVLDDATRLDLRRAHVTFTTDAGAPQGTMEADRGALNQRTQILEGWGNVVVTLVDGRTLRSPHVTYNQLTHEISSDTTYSATRGSDEQHGIGFVTDQTFQRPKCLRACGGNFSVLIPER